jgi:hypothetical protein
VDLLKDNPPGRSDASRQASKTALFDAGDGTDDPKKASIGRLFSNGPETFGIGIGTYG